MEIVKTTFDKIKKYRTDYLNSLSEFQEVFIELMIYDSDFYMLLMDEKEVGYIIKTHENALIEFHVLEKYISDSENFFKQVLKELFVTNIYCKSFDSLLLSNCLSNSLSYSLLGKLYRDYVEALIEKDPNIKMKKSDHSSIEFLFGQDDSITELFDTKKQLIEFVQNEHVFEFYKNDEFIGCGMIIRTISGWNFCDLGVWVNPLTRGNYFGTQIILNLREFALKNNMRPSCGCAIDNFASQKIIERSGYVSRYRMINFNTK